MSRERQKNQRELAFMAETGSEAPTNDRRDELLMAKREPESEETTERLMEEICEPENMRKALKRVQSNKGAPGVDGITVDDLPGYLRRNWPKHREGLLEGTYKPKPARRKEIAKPDGGVRNLSIPTVSAYCTSYNTASESSRLSFWILEERRTHSSSSCSFSAQSVIQYGEPALSLRASINPRSIQ